jgi:hypothetical protein
MKINDIAHLKYPFKLTNFDLDSEHMVLNVLVTEQYPTWLYLPIYIGNLGVKLAKCQYTTPSNELPVNHPDYYEFANNRVIYEGKEYQLRLDKMFDFFGTYYLVHESGNYIRKQARKQSTNEIRSMLDNTVGRLLPGELITGRIIHIISRMRDELSFVSSVSEVVKMSMWQTKFSVVLQDETTYIEYELPLELTKVKS